jgi:hypothetical protein
MVTREELVVRQAKVSIVASANQECIGLGKTEDPAVVGTGQNS